MKVLVIGAASRFGPHVAEALEADHDLLLTDVVDVASKHPTAKVDISSPEEMLRAAEGMDAIVNCSVQRQDRQIAWDVNTRGCYNMMRAAVTQGVKRVVNTGPHFVIAGRSYETFDYLMSPDAPPHPGTNLYALSKSAGQEICRLFTETHDVHVLCLLFFMFRELDEARPGRNHPFAVTWRDAARAAKRAVEIPDDDLPSRCEIFNIFARMPHERFSNEKSLRVLGWEPRDTVSYSWSTREPE